MISKLLGIIILLTCFCLIYLFETSSSAVGFMRIFHWPAILLTGIGPLGLILIASDRQALLQALKLLIHSPQRLRKTIISDRLVMRELSEKYYLEGLSSFAKINNKEVSPSFFAVLEKLSLKIPISDVKFLLAELQDSASAEISHGLNVLSLAVKLTPSIGMLGTILGMVNLLGSLSEPSEIGSHMSLALLTTFYGLFFSLVIWTPVQYRLKAMLEMQGQEFDQIDHWLSLLEKRKPPEYMVQPSIFGTRKTPAQATS